MATRTEIRLAPDEKWRIEVDANLINELRLAMGWTWTELSLKSGARKKTIWDMRHKGTCLLSAIAKVATAFQIQPGELIIWFPVPRDYPDNPKWGYGRKDVKRRKDYQKPPLQNKHWSQEDKNKLLALRGAGFYWREIAGMLSRSPESVKCVWYKLTREDRLKNG